MLRLLTLMFRAIWLVHMADMAAEMKGYLLILFPLSEMKIQASPAHLFLIPLQDIFLYILLINQEKTAEYRLKLIINYSRQNAVGMNNSYGIIYTDFYLVHYELNQFFAYLAYSLHFFCIHPLRMQYKPSNNPVILKVNI